MRITSGEFRGRSIAVPPGDDVRPTQDRVREALFSMLGESVQGATFLDVFAGSGAVGLEALSRGAKRAVFIERDNRAFACLTVNIARCNAAGRCEAHRADALAWLAARGMASCPGRAGCPQPAVSPGRASCPQRAACPGRAGCPQPAVENGLAACSPNGIDIAYADPPYALAAQGIYSDVMRLLADGGLMSPDGILVAEMDSRHSPDEHPAWELIRDRTYGHSRLVIYRLGASANRLNEGTS